MAIVEGDPTKTNLKIPMLTVFLGAKCDLGAGLQSYLANQWLFFPAGKHVAPYRWISDHQVAVLQNGEEQEEFFHHSSSYVTMHFVQGIISLPSNLCCGLLTHLSVLWHAIFDS